MPTLDWLNRDAAFEIARKVPYRLLEQVSEHASTTQTTKARLHKGSEHETTESRQSLISGLEPPSNKALSEQADALESAAAVSTPAPALAPTEDNLLIQGDNLEALKSLLPFYRGQVKCTFIDPPYNTKSAFEHYDDNLEHAQWLTMMLPRLQLLRELLAEDGSIWVTIDDNEGHYLKVLMDEVFGRGNFLASVAWQRKYSVSNNFVGIASIVDHVYCYSKSSSFEANLLERTEESVARYLNPDDDPRGPWKAVDYLNQATPEKRPNLCYEIVNPYTHEVIRNTKKAWKYEPSVHSQHVAEKRLWWGKQGQNSVPALKLFLSEVRSGMTPHNWWPHEEVGHTDESKKEVLALFGTANVFDTPKPERLLKRILHIATNPNDLILDSFLGSGTTAAVAQKMGRRWIGIEMGEHAQTHCVPRLQKVLDGEQGGISKTVGWQGGGSFRFMKLGAPIFDDGGAIHPEVRFATLAAFVWMQETRTPWHKKKGSSPFLGTHDGIAYYLLFNGILGDRRPQGGNVLTSAILAWLNQTYPHPQTGSPRVIYGESVRLGPARLAAENVTFKQIPYDVARG